MPTWIGQAARNGIVTSRYPAEPATDAEVPETARPPVPLRGDAALHDGVARCPVGAIAEDALDRGKCIRCARCRPAGFEFRGPVEASTATRAELRVGPAALAGPGRVEALPPLVGFPRSLHLFLVDAGSCNACNLEVLGLGNPLYDSQRLGIFFTNSPRHADVLLVVGVPTPEMAPAVLRAYEALPAPKAVIAVGVCPISGGAFAGTPGLLAGLEVLVPVDVFVPGCPPAPIEILDAILRVHGRARSTRGD